MQKISTFTNGSVVIGARIGPKDGEGLVVDTARLTRCPQ